MAVVIDSRSARQPGVLALIGARSCFRILLDSSCRSFVVMRGQAPMCGFRPSDASVLDLGVSHSNLQIYHGN